MGKIFVLKYFSFGKGIPRNSSPPFLSLSRPFGEKKKEANKGQYDREKNVKDVQYFPFEKGKIMSFVSF